MIIVQTKTVLSNQVQQQKKLVKYAKLLKLQKVQEHESLQNVLPIIYMM